MPKSGVTKQQLIDALNEDLAREYQAIIQYVVYSQVIKGAQYQSIAKELEVHARRSDRHS
jgi:bacterioferritin